MKNLMNFQTSAKLVKEPGEEKLYSSYAPQLKKGRVENVIVGVDSGSTQVRSTVCRLSDEVEAFDHVYVIPSTFTDYKDTKVLVPEGPELFYNMDSHIMSSILPPHNKFDKVRVLRGNKCINANGALSRINSSIQKVNTEAFYINIIDAIAYSLIMDATERNMGLSETFNVYLACSLPPDDVTSTKNKSTFINSIKGTFTWVSKDLGVSITINVADVLVTTEPEAAIKCHYMLQGEEIPETVMGIDAGGRSIGSEILLGGTSFMPARKTFRYGGNQLIDSIADAYVNMHGGSRPKDDAIKRALANGVYTRAKNSTDITYLIKQKKYEFGLNLHSDVIKNIFDTQRTVFAEDIEAIVLSGRCFGRGDYDCSIADVLIEEFRKISPECEIVQIDQYLIPVGNAIMGMLEFGSVLDENDVEQVKRLPSAEDEIEEVAVTSEVE